MIVLLGLTKQVSGRRTTNEKKGKSMKKIYLLLGLLILVFIISACSTRESNNTDKRINTGNATVEEVLLGDENADVFLFNDIVYKNAEGIEWVVNQVLTLDQEKLKIKKQTNNIDEFTNGVATTLPAGTKIYETIGGKGDILIAIVNGKEIRYLGLREG